MICVLNLQVVLSLGILLAQAVNIGTQHIYVSGSSTYLHSGQRVLDC